MKEKLIKIILEKEANYKLKEINGLRGGPILEDLTPKGILKIHPAYVQTIQNIKTEKYEIVISKQPIPYANQNEMNFIFKDGGTKEYRNAQYISGMISINYPNMSKILTEVQRLKDEEKYPKKTKKNFLSKLFSQK